VLRLQFTLVDSPLQVYYSALVFAPKKTLVSRTFADQVPEKAEMLSIKDADWDACRSTLEGHSRDVTAVAFSPDGQVLHTNAGEIPLSSPSIAPLPSWQQKQPSSLLVQG
jgi:WD40 repeat protein